MDEITEAAAHATFAAVKSAASFAEVGHGRQFAIDRASGVPAAVERVAGGLRRVFIFEARVDVADEICEIRELALFKNNFGNGWNAHLMKRLVWRNLVKRERK